MKLRIRHHGGVTVTTVFVITALIMIIPPSAAAVSAGPHGASRTSVSTTLAAGQAALYPLERISTISVAASCPTVRRARAGLARDGIKSAACVAPTTAPDSGVRAATPAANSLCKVNEVVNDRHAACGIATIHYVVLDMDTGKVLGTGIILVAYSEALNPASRSWNLPVSLEMTTASGVVKAGTEATVGIDCTGGCIPSPAWIGQPLSVGKVHTHTFHPSSPGTATHSTHQTPDVALFNPAATTQSPPSVLKSMGPARCDTGVAYKGTSGCVFSNVAGEYFLHLKGSAGAVAKHVEVAQQTKPLHFGWFGHGLALTRATPASVTAANRKVACPKKKYPNPDTCDEYPFAATYQGAAYFPQSNSTAPVSAKENSTEGGFRAAMYRTERLFDHDEYWVFVVP